jgi:putative ABC transport system ATP-binding protein
VKRPAGIRLDSVWKHYVTPAGPVEALQGISFEVEAGSSLAVTGPSGCGKSTLLGLIGGIETPSSGQIFVGGEEISSLPERRRVSLRRNDFGFIFQRDNLLPFLTAFENVALQLALRAENKGPECYLEVLGEMGLADHLHKLPDQLSGGQRQRVAVGRALAGRPAVILADEPTGSLDAHNSAAVMELLIAAQKQAGSTLVVATHDTRVAGVLDGTLRLRDGRLASDGLESPPGERSSPMQPETRANA